LDVFYEKVEDEVNARLRVHPLRFVEDERSKLFHENTKLKEENKNLLQITNPSPITEEVYWRKCEAVDKLKKENTKLKEEREDIDKIRQNSASAVAVVCQAVDKLEEEKVKLNETIDKLKATPNIAGFWEEQFGKNLAFWKDENDKLKEANAKLTEENGILTSAKVDDIVGNNHAKYDKLKEQVEKLKDKVIDAINQDATAQHKLQEENAELKEEMLRLGESEDNLHDVLYDHDIVECCECKGWVDKEDTQFCDANGFFTCDGQEHHTECYKKWEDPDVSDQETESDYEPDDDE
jgi:DNA repair exonuclease SbcCD ATPase subunit